MRGLVTFIVAFNFLLGILFGFGARVIFSGTEEPLYVGSSVLDKPSAFDRIKEQQISIEDGKVVISMAGSDVRLSRYTNSNSMDQTLDEGHNGIEIVPKTSNDIHVGDITAFRFGNSLVVHRVVEIGDDDRGWYATTKGDNNDAIDPGKRRFKDIERVTVGILF